MNRRHIGFRVLRTSFVVEPEFLVGASCWYDHEPEKPRNQQTASALRLTQQRVPQSWQRGVEMST